MLRYIALFIICFSYGPWCHAQAGSPTTAPSSSSAAPDPTQALLAQLHEVITPDAPSVWPLAVGWWCILLLLLILIGFFIFYLKRYRQNRLYRRHGLAELNLLQQQNEQLNDEQFMQAVLSVLKRSALVAFPSYKKTITSIWGETLLTFLVSSCNAIHADDIDRAWLDCAYNPEQSINRSSLIQFAERWIKHHSLESYQHALANDNANSVAAMKDKADV